MNLKKFVLVLLIAGVAGWYISENIEEHLPPAPPLPIENVVVKSPAPAEPKHLPVPARHPLAPLKEVKPTAPVTERVIEPVLPRSLDQADGYLRERLPQLIESDKQLALLNLNYFIQKLVLFVDHLPEKNIPRMHLPFVPPAPGFITRGTGDKRPIGKKNARRYRNYVALLEAVPDVVLIRLYRGLYPLFQQAYREAGHPAGHFNDRLIEAFDDLLQTPEPSGPVQLVRHVSRFRYADPALEKSSAGQKILLRMGLENTRRVKRKIQQLRTGLARKDQ
ncbi:MAG: DUF3014 domain-containing protein [Geopsychrobacter sp.]|nr:DUF3014 domain-containing protein [Geopsychrobacter sp.]